MYRILLIAAKRLCQLLVVICALVVNNVAEAQNSIDSLEQLLTGAVGHQRLEVYQNLIKHYGKIDSEKALIIADDARRLALEIGDSSHIVTSSRMVGQFLNRMSKNLEAEKILLEVLPIAKRNGYKKEYKSILSNLAIAYTFQAKYDQSLEMNFQALQLREADNEYLEITSLLNNIGLVYFKLSNWERALDYYERALELKKKINDDYDLDRVYMNIGLCYNQMQKYDRALEFFQKGFTVCEGGCRDQIMVEGDYGLAIAYFNTGDLTKAEMQSRQSYKIAGALDHKRFQAENLLLLARINLERNLPDSALLMLGNSERLSASYGYSQILIDSYRNFATAYSMKHDYRSAAKYYEKYTELKDSIYGSELIDRLAQIETNFAERQNLKTIADKDEVIQRQRALNIAIVVIAILAGALVFVLYRSNRIKKKVNAALSEAKAIIEDQNKQLLNSNIHLNKELEQRNIELEHANDSLRKVNDELDNFIYKTSHDIRGPLASLKGMCNVALIDVVDPIALGYLNKIDITADKLNSILTRLLIVNQLNHSVLGSEPISFEDIISDILAIEKKKGLPDRFVVRTHVDDHLQFHSDKEFVKIILENLIANAIKFYNDSERADPFVDVSIVADENAVKIRVIDNGIGIKQVNPDKIFQMFSRASERSQTGGIGLYITKTAVQKLSGTIALRSTPEGYTEFLVLLPHSRSKVLA